MPIRLSPAVNAVEPLRALASKHPSNSSGYVFAVACHERILLWTE